MFLLPIDAQTTRALGSPEYAYGPILVSKLLMAAVGATVFMIASMLLRKGVSRGAGRALRGGALCGALYSATLVVLLHLAIWVDAAPAVITLWVGVVLLPIGAAWLCSRTSPRGIEHEMPHGA